MALLVRSIAHLKTPQRLRWLTQECIRTDTLVVTQQASYSGWQNSGMFVFSSQNTRQRVYNNTSVPKRAVIDCATTSTCEEVSTNLNESCTTDLTTWDKQFGGQLEAKFPSWFGSQSTIVPSLAYSTSWGGGKEIQICTTTSDTGYV